MCRQENQLLPHCLIIPRFNEEYIKEPSVRAWVPGCQTMSGVCLEVFILHNLSWFIVLTEVWRRRCWFTVQGLLFKVDWRWIGKNCGENSDPSEFTSTSSWVDGRIPLGWILPTFFKKLHKPIIEMVMSRTVTECVAKIIKSIWPNWLWMYLFILWNVPSGESVIATLLDNSSF